MPPRARERVDDVLCVNAATLRHVEHHHIPGRIQRRAPAAFGAVVPNRRRNRVADLGRQGHTLRLRLAELQVLAERLKPVLAHQHEVRAKPDDAVRPRHRAPHHEPRADVPRSTGEDAGENEYLALIGDGHEHLVCAGRGVVARPCLDGHDLAALRGQRA